MPPSPRYLDLRCPVCLWRETCGPGEMLAWLRNVGKARPNKGMDLEILYEVFRSAAEAFVCPKCGRRGLNLFNAVEAAHWPEVPSCRKCGQPIGRERLAAVPNTRVCAACQRDMERGAAKPDREFCPRCGAPMEVRAVQEGRRTRYVLSCSARPPCPF